MSAIERLFPELSPSELVSNHFGKRPVVHHGPLSRLSGLADEKMLFSR
jgi:hypothetical protein